MTKTDQRRHSMLAWIFLLFAGITEVIWAIALKFSHGFTHLTASVITILGMILSFYLLSLAMKSIPISIAYPVWTGIGAVGTAIIGMVVLGDSISLLKILCLVLIIAGVIGLKVFSH